jgi:hypothetical protein
MVLNFRHHRLQLKNDCPVNFEAAAKLEKSFSAAFFFCFRNIKKWITVIACNKSNPDKNVCKKGDGERNFIHKVSFP